MTLGSLSVSSPPAVTDRSPEDQDLLERSTKKTKRGREEQSVASTPRQGERGIEHAEGSGTPDSGQWKTPATTPEQAWVQREGKQIAEDEEESEDEAMEEIETLNGYPVIRVSNEEKERLRRPWRRSLIVRLLGRTVNYPYLYQRLQRMWRTESPFDLIALNHDFYIAKFESMKDYETAKYGGPWMVFDHYLTVQDWRPNFDSRTNKMEKLLAWIRFPSLPIEYFDEKFLKKIGKTIGRPVKIDVTTSLASKGKFARVCVEFDITKPLLSRFVIEGVEWPVEYEGIHLVCFKCGVYGHRQDNCIGSEGNLSQEPNNASASSAKTCSMPTEKYGAWMLVTRRDRRRGGNQVNRQTNTPSKDNQQVNSAGVAQMAEGLGEQTRPQRETVTGGEVTRSSDQGGIPAFNQATGRGNQRGRGGRGGTPNRAASELEHTVVRGSNGGRNITSTVVHHSEEHLGFSFMSGTEEAHEFEPPNPLIRTEKDYRHDPPDPMIGVERRYDNDPPDNSHDHPITGDSLTEAMVDDTGQIDHGIAVSGDQANRICSSFGFNDWIRVEAVGYSGGIWLLWKGSANIIVTKTHPQFITAHVPEENKDPWQLSLVYGSPNQPLRRQLYSELFGSNSGFDGSWLAVGDFNVVTSREEVSNTEGFTQSRCANFNEWIFREGLVDLGYSGSKYTRMRGVNTDSFRGARLDRALSNIDWKLQFPNTIIQHLPMVGSDHAPLLVNTGAVQALSRPASFRFNVAWATHKSFQALIKDSWRSDLDLHTNKKRVAEILSNWSRDIFGSVTQRKKRLLGRLEGIQCKMAQNVRSDMIRLERKLRLELDEVLYQEELTWFQRSREEWVISGDRNTRYYQTATSIKASKVKVSMLIDENGQEITGKGELVEHVQSYFTKLFTEDLGSEPTSLDHGHFPIITETKWNELSAPLTLEEIKSNLFDMAPCKAPGPDGYSASFYQKTWGTVGECLLKFATKFFDEGSLPEECNDTIITLIPKIPEPKHVKQFRPISLCNVSYKLLTKIMSSRLRNILTKLIGPHQTSFVPGRQISDNTLVFQEVLSSMRNKKRKRGLDDDEDRPGEGLRQTFMGIYQGYSTGYWIQQHMDKADYGMHFFPQIGSRVGGPKNRLV
ncbi:PREDICTED: uncharacterized protein LOC109147318 [Ipomoea nil]|uniref:uncharacterized protein LOC109147318 n=1 Tax=Ipomoea nil TaxID=35883 RepID=UPI000900A793|nr:PREDICTED: uncharacterized protein LOC109147318 [Ipomoea nil]